MKEGKTDDLAALFLPDLLTPIGNNNGHPNNKTEDSGYFFGIEQTTDNTKSSQEYPQILPAYGADSTFRQGSVPDMALVGQRTQSNTNFDLSLGSLYRHDGYHTSQPFANLDYGQLYKDNGNREKPIPAPLRARSKVLPSQSPISQTLGHFFNNYDNFLWLLQVEAYQFQRPSIAQPNEVNMDPLPHLNSITAISPLSEPFVCENNPSVRRKKALAPAIPDMKIDYSPNSLLHLLDMSSSLSNRERYQIRNAYGEPATLELHAFLHGRFYTNNLDNYIYQVGASGAIYEKSVYKPAVILCCRRNFINIHLVVKSTVSDTLSIDREPITRLRLQIGATPQGPDAGVASFSISDTENNSTRAGDNLHVQTIGEKHDLDLKDLHGENYFMFRKLKFNSSTVNTLKLNTQSYYCLTVSLIAELPSGSRVIESLISAPIIVRGRNPSFYNTRNNIQIKPRSPYFRASYGRGEITPSAVPHQERVSLDAQPLQSG
ncbi:hypothetical protein METBISCDRAFT_22548 [Metschnikowia bicuspidata]|uniref:NDT80 domain-containing protein n=1 Tax=Metschnikowia bicuspidata TaxID=27322 RepID=A0A4P9ZFK3_9ASCO|nr:hypothetical protein METBISCDRAFT_22548 [Metschnikowia bicuspidata]